MDLRIRHAIEHKDDFYMREFFETGQAFGCEARGVQFDAAMHPAPNVINGIANGAAHGPYRSHCHVGKHWMYDSP